MPNSYQSTYTGQHNDAYDARITDLETFRQTFLNMVYPIGSIYMSMNETDPSTLFGGTWERISGRFLLGCGGNGPGANSNTDFGSLASAQQTWFSDVQPGNTGGEYFHTLTTAQTPAHTHTRGTMDITGKVMVWTDYNKGNSDFDTTCVKGAFHFTTGVDTEVGKNSNASNGNYDATRIVNFTASRTWSGETSSVGENESHNNMPPYLAVAIWKRTA